MSDSYGQRWQKDVPRDIAHHTGTGGSGVSYEEGRMRSSQQMGALLDTGSDADIGRILESMPPAVISVSEFHSVELISYVFRRKK